MNHVEPSQEQFEKAIDYLLQDISTLRTGRATPALVEDVAVEAYGTKQPLKTIASISSLDAKTLSVDPWDKSLVQDIESAIRNSGVGISPVNDGTVIRLPLPELTAERRQDLIKVLHKKIEEARIAIRKIREDVRKEIEKAEAGGGISEDEKFTQYDQLDKMVKEYNEKIKEIGAKKEKEIQTV